jgi:hypothetical protein
MQRLGGRAVPVARPVVLAVAGGTARLTVRLDAPADPITFASIADIEVPDLGAGYYLGTWGALTKGAPDTVLPRVPEFFERDLDPPGPSESEVQGVVPVDGLLDLLQRYGPTVLAYDGSPHMLRAIRLVPWIVDHPALPSLVLAASRLQMAWEPDPPLTWASEAEEPSGLFLSAAAINPLTRILKEVEGVVWLGTYRREGETGDILSLGDDVTFWSRRLKAPPPELLMDFAASALAVEEAEIVGHLATTSDDLGRVARTAPVYTDQCVRGGLEFFRLDFPDSDGSTLVRVAGAERAIGQYRGARVSLLYGKPLLTAAAKQLRGRVEAVFPVQLTTPSAWTDEHGATHLLMPLSGPVGHSDHWEVRSRGRKVRDLVQP